jgi:uncharacterized membrane protein
VIDVLEIIGFVIGLIGMGIIVWGASTTLVEFLRLEWRRFKGVNIFKTTEILRHHLGTYLLLGLEFLIAADIIHTMAKPDLQGLIILGSIVAIRTIISYFLNRELSRTNHLKEGFPKE